MFGALSMLLNGGGVNQLKTITTELNKALAGQEPQVRSMLKRVDTLVTNLDGASRRTRRPSRTASRPSSRTSPRSVSSTSTCGPPARTGFLGNGSVIDQADTAIPAPPTDVLSSVNDLASSVDLENLRTVVDEFGAAFEGRGDDLQVLLDTGSEFVQAADAALPTTTRLIADGETVLRTQAEQGDALKGFASGAKELAAELKGSDTDLRKLIAAAPDAAGQISGLLRDLDPSFGVVVANLLTTSEVAVTRQRGMEELLVKLPAVVAAGSSAVDEDGARFGMSVTFFEPLPCTAGYGGTTYRKGLDLSKAPAVNTKARCTSSPGTGINVRGSANAPKGGAVPEPAEPGSMLLGAEAGDRLPGALGVTGDAPPTAHGMAGLLGLGGGE